MSRHARVAQYITISRDGHDQRSSRCASGVQRGERTERLIRAQVSGASDAEASVVMYARSAALSVAFGISYETPLTGVIMPGVMPGTCITCSSLADGDGVDLEEHGGQGEGGHAGEGLGWRARAPDPGDPIGQYL